MKYRLLGNSGLRVSEAALGTMTFGEDWGWGSLRRHLSGRPLEDRCDAGLSRIGSEQPYFSMRTRAGASAEVTGSDPW